MNAHWTAVACAAGPLGVALFFWWLDRHTARRPYATPQQVWEAGPQWREDCGCHICDDRDLFVPCDRHEREAADLELWDAQLEDK